MECWEQGLSSEYYTSAGHFTKEIDRIVLRNWMFLCASDMVASESFISLEIANLPVVVMRSANGTVFSFINVCPHRGAPLLKGVSGRIPKKLICPFHGITYYAEGSRRGEATGECSLRLRSFKTVEMNGLIFANLNSNVGFFEFYSGLDSRWSEFFSASDQFEFAAHFSLEGRFNWKLFIEAFQECYHCPSVHKRLSEEFLLKSYRVQNFNNYSVHSCRRDGVNYVTGKSPGEWLWLYPNIGIPFYENQFYIVFINPVSVNQTQLRYYFFNKKESHIDPEKFKHFVKMLGMEDIGICEAVQLNLERDAIRYSMINRKRENGVKFFYHLVEKDLIPKSGC